MRIIKSKLKEISKNLDGTGKAILLDSTLKDLKEVSAKAISGTLKRTRGVAAIVIDGAATGTVIKSSEELGVQVIVAKNFQTTDQN